MVKERRLASARGRANRARGINFERRVARRLRDAGFIVERLWSSQFSIGGHVDLAIKDPACSVQCKCRTARVDPSSILGLMEGLPGLRAVVVGGRAGRALEVRIACQPRSLILPGDRPFNMELSWPQFVDLLQFLRSTDAVGAAGSTEAAVNLWRQSLFAVRALKV